MLSRVRRSMADKDQGFTLIELLVVIIIIGILAAIAVPVFLNQRKKGVDAAIKSDMKAMAVLQETAINDDPSLPGIEWNGAAALTGTLAPLAAFKKTSTTTISVSVQASGYCIKGSAATGTGGLTSWYWYDSNNGGLNGTLSTAAPTGKVSCP